MKEMNLNAVEQRVRQRYVSGEIDAAEALAEFERDFDGEPDCSRLWQFLSVAAELSDDADGSGTLAYAKNFANGETFSAYRLTADGEYLDLACPVAFRIGENFECALDLDEEFRDRLLDLDRHFDSDLADAAACASLINVLYPEIQRAGMAFPTIENGEAGRISWRLADLAIRAPALCENGGVEFDS